MQLLHFLARNVRDLRVPIIGTYRPEDILTEVGEKAHPLKASLQDMTREGIVYEIHLGRIEHGPLIKAIEGMLGGSANETMSQRIVKESGGNPLFLVETVRMLVASGSIVLKEGMWSFPEEVTITIPSTIREVILRRLERLPQDKTRLLECASVVGEHFDPRIVEQVLKLDRMQVLESLDSLEDRYKLLRATGDEYRFDHEKIREVTYERISSPRRKELHRQVGMVIEVGSPDERLYGSLSYHFALSGQTEKCAHYSLLAGEYFLRESGGAEAIPHFLKALEGMPLVEGTKEDRFRALVGLGDSYADQADFPSADRAYQDALSLGLGPRQEAQVLWRKAYCYFPSYLGKGSISQARQLLERANVISELDDFDLGSILSFSGELEVYEGHVDSAESYFSRAEETLARTNGLVRLSDTMCSHADLLSSLGKVQEAIRKANEGLDVLKGTRNPQVELKLRLILGETCMALGEEELAMEHLDAAEDVAIKSGHLYILLVHIDKESLKELQGDFEGARAEALVLMRYAERREWLPMVKASVCSRLAQMEIMTGRVEEVEALVRRAMQLTRDFQWEMRTPTRARIVLARAMLLGAKGKMDECMALSKEAMGFFDVGIKDPFSEALARQTFGLFLSRMREEESARKQLLRARELFSSMGNKRQEERLDATIAGSRHQP